MSTSDEYQGEAASCHLCVGAGGYEGFDGEWVECSCQRRQPQAVPDYPVRELTEEEWAAYLDAQERKLDV